MNSSLLLQCIFFLYCGSCTWIFLFLRLRLSSVGLSINLFHNFFPSVVPIFLPILFLSLFFCCFITYISNYVRLLFLLFFATAIHILSLCCSCSYFFSSTAKLSFPLLLFFLFLSLCSFYLFLSTVWFFCSCIIGPSNVINTWLVSNIDW